MTAALSEDVKKAEVPDAFDLVAGRYDLMTTLNPGYRSNLFTSAKRLGVKGSGRILDLCCGTGISTEAVTRAYPYAHIDALDASGGMLQVASQKRLRTPVNWVLGNAMDLEAAGIEGPYDGILMAYGIRNVPDPDACLAGILEVLAPGATVCLHEYSVADSHLAKAKWRAVTNGLVIPLGKMTSPKATIYRYLKDSVLAFDGVQAFESRLRNAGFIGVETKRLSGWQRGVVHSFLARRPAA